MSLRTSVIAMTGTAGQADGDKGVKGDKGLKGLAYNSLSTRGYTMGGGVTSSPRVDSFPFSTPFTTATSSGSLLYSFARRGGGTGSTTDAYHMGGQTSTASDLQIQSFPFTSGFTVVDVGDLSSGSEYSAGAQSDTDGYRCRDNIDRFPFSTPFTTATNIGNNIGTRRRLAAQSSSSDGYNSGGAASPPFGNSLTIDRFPFSTPFTTATDVGDLSIAKQANAGQSSDADGYTSGDLPAPLNNVIDSFPFSTPFTTATDVGDLSQSRYSVAGQSSSSDGYTSGGSPPSAGLTTIDSFPFSTPFTTATDVGDLSQGRYECCGTQG